MTERAHTYGESLSESTTTSTTFADKTSITFTPDASTDYWLFWAAKISGSSISNSNFGRLRDDTGAATLREVFLEPKDTDGVDGHNDLVFGVDKFTSSGSPPSQTFSIEFAVENGGNTGRIQAATLLALKAKASDQYAESESDVSTTLTTPQDKTTLTFTPATAGDYLLVASAEIRDATGGSVKAHLDVNGTAYFDGNGNGRPPRDTTDWMSWSGVIRLNFAASSQTLKIQWWAGGTTAHIRRAAILAIRLSEQANNYYGESLTRSTTTSTTNQDKATLTATPQARNHVIFNSSAIDWSTSNESAYIRRVKDGTEQVVDVYEPASASDKSSTHFVRESLANASTEWKTQYRNELGIGTLGISDSTIAVVDLEEAGAAAVTSLLPPLNPVLPLLMR